MGLDGISVNQLRFMQESGSSDVNSVRFNSQDSVKTVDGLAKGQIVDPDGRNKQDNSEFEFENSENQKETEEKSEQVIKYDLSKSDKYELKLDSDEKTILIIDKATCEVVQKINSDGLSKFVGFLSFSQGTMVNRKI